jgi:hypothetical protein
MRFLNLLGQCAIQELVSTDYAYRLIVQKSAWMQLLAELADEIDYGNFESEVARHQGRAKAEERSQHEAW